MGERESVSDNGRFSRSSSPHSRSRIKNPLRVSVDHEARDSASESTPLLFSTADVDSNAGRGRRRRRVHENGRSIDSSSFLQRKLEKLIFPVMSAIPAVLLGLILNLLDALSYGIIIFPTSSDVFPASATQAGISMFLISTIISQISFSLGGSTFPGAVGSMMIEVMPFLHIMVKTIQDVMGPGADPKSVLATIMIAYTSSTILTGLVFLALGHFRLGNLIQFFPRHILVGCIGGIGFFLFVTAIEVTTGVTPGLDWAIITKLFLPRNFALWGTCLGLAFLLKTFQTRFTHPLFVPAFYMVVPVVFYIIAVGMLGYSIAELREWGWLFDMPGGDDGDAKVPWWTYWTYFNGFVGIDWGAAAATLGTQLALIFFAVLHVPINVPALAVSLQRGVDVNHEIVGHGISNLLGGFMGVPQSYLVYSNSLLFIRSGGGSTRAPGLILAAATVVVLVVGGDIVGYVPTLVVGSLIFHLGFDLVKESLWDTWRSGISKWEYGTILCIVFVMGFFGKLPI